MKTKNGKGLKKSSKKSKNKSVIMKTIPAKDLEDKSTSREEKTKKNKENLLIALTKSLGIVSEACKKVKLSRQIFYQYCLLDKEFKKQVSAINEIALDFAESKLLNLIADENVTAILFYLKCKGKKRGYVETQQLEHTGELGIKVMGPKEILGSLSELAEKITNKSTDKLLEWLNDNGY